MRWTLKYGWNLMKKSNRRQEKLTQMQEGEIFMVNSENIKQPNLNEVWNSYTGIKDVG